MMRFRLFVSLIVLTGTASLTTAQTISLADQREALKQQEEQLNNKLRERWNEMSKDEVMKPFHQEMREARNAWRKAEAEDPRLLEAKQAKDAARKKLESAVWKKTRQSEAGTAIHDQIAKQNEILDDIEAQRRRNDFDRREVERAIEDMPALRELSTNRWQADRMLREAQDENKELKAAEDRYRAARRALDQKIKALPEYAAAEAAKQAVEAARDSPNIRLAKAARGHADKAYNEKRKELQDNDPAMRDVRREREGLEKSYNSTREKRDALTNQMRELAQNIERKDESVAPMRQAYAAADDNYDKVKDEVTKPRRAAHDQARRAYDKQMRERYQDDNAATELRNRLDDVRRRMRIIDLKKQIRDLESKAENADAGESGDIRF